MSEHLKDNLKERMASGGESNLIIYLDQLFVFRLHGVLGFWGFGVLGNGLVWALG